MQLRQDVELKCLQDCPEFLQKASQWFRDKWGIPVEAYYDSIKKSIEQKANIPRWYIVLNERQDIVAGAGIIENDFHDREDLTPNLCALFVEQEYRNRGIAKYILDFARKDLGILGFSKLYLVTDYTDFYEKYGWEFLTMVTGDDGSFERMYVAPTF